MGNIAVPWTITGILFIVLIIVFLNPDKAQRWSSWVLKGVASTNSFFARRSISGRIQGVVNQFARRFNKESFGIMPYSVKIEWVKEVEKDALLSEEGLVIVRLSHKQEEIQKALTLSMLKFCRKSLIPNGRLYLSDRTVRGIDLVTTKKMLYESKEKGSLDYFLDDILSHEIKADQDLCTKCQAMEMIDERGLFSRVLLREYQELGRKLYPMTPNGSTVVEGDEFLDFIEQIANKEPEEDVELFFDKNWIRVAFVLVARPEVIEYRGFSPYIKRLETLQKKRTETVYIHGMGDNIAYTQRIAEMAQNKGLGEIANSVKFRARYPKGRRVRSINITFNMHMVETAE